MDVRMAKTNKHTHSYFYIFTKPQIKRKQNILGTDHIKQISNVTLPK